MENSQHDETAIQTRSVSSSVGWGNTRSVTHIDVRETLETLKIQTTIAGLQPDSLSVTIQGPYFIVEALLAHNGERGRYVRHVPELVDVCGGFVNVAYDATGQLVLSLLKSAKDDSKP